MVWRAAAVAALLAFRAAADPLSDGYAFLRGAQDARGAFGAATGENETVATHEAIEAFAAASQSQTPEAENARLFLALLPAARDSELTLRRSISLTGTAFSLAPAALETHATGFAAPEATVGAWSLLAFQKTGDINRSDAKELARTVAQLALPTGCHAFADNDASPELTSLVSRALRPFAFDPLVAFARSRALVCLQSRQQPGGGFGSVEGTASAALAFLEADLSFGPALASARSFLLATQRPDGSWGSVRATALALQALGGAPDWETVPRQISGQVHFFTDTSEVLQGTPVHAFVDVKNSANSPAPAAPLRVTAFPLGGGAAVVLGDFTVPPLQPGQTTQVLMTLQSSALLGHYRMEAEVDALRVLSELDRTNNVAISYLDVVVGDDLMVSGSSVSFTPAGPSSVSASVRVRNLGSPLVAPVTVEVRRGSATTGALLGSFVVPSGLARAADFTGSVTFSNTGMNGFTAIWAVVDPANVLAERNEENNVALRFYEHGAEAPVDLQLVAADFAVQGPAIAGRLVTVNGQVRNLSANDANRFLVTAYDSGGTPRASTEVESAPAGTSTPISFSLQLGGSLSLQLVADSALQLNDTNRANNTVLFSINTNTNPTNLLVTSFTTSSVSAQNGLPVTLTAQLRNTGDALVETSLRITEEGDGVDEVSTMHVQLDKGETRTVVLGPFITPDRPSVYRACLDPFGTVEESNENDNCADVSMALQTTNLTLTSRDITMTPVGADVGEKVSFTATVHNNSAVPARGILEWWQGGPGFFYGRKLAEEVVTVPASSTKTVSYDVIRNDGTPEISARLTRITPRSSASNIVQGGRHFFLQDIIDLPYADTSGPFTQLVRVGRLTGRAEPELVLGLDRVSVTPQVLEIVVLERANGTYQPLWTQALPGIAEDIALIDLERDGQAELVALSGYHRPTPTTTQMNLAVFDSAGAPRWTRSFPLLLGDTGDVRTDRIGLVDHDNDGVVDVVTAFERLRVLSGVDGTLLLDVDHGTNLGTRASVTPLDVTGDGPVEYLVTTEVGFARLYSHQGQLLWQRSNPNVNSLASGAVLDLNLDGQGDFAETGNGTRFIDLATNTVAAQSPFGTTVPIIGGALRQDGLAYALFTLVNAGRLQAVRGDFTEVWNEPMPPTVINTGDADLVLTLADVMGRGRPQLIGFSCYFTFLAVDGRSGKPVVPYPDSANTSCTRGGQSLGNFAYQPPVVADLEGDGLGSHIVLSHTEGNLNATHPTGAPQYGRAEALIFHSPRWKKMPPTWPTHTLVKGRIGDDLKLQGGTDSFQWWASHNTFNQQFDVEPARLLPDLTVAMPAQGPATANQTFLIAATLKNAGGLLASNVPVAFWDGNPADGGTRLGAVTAAGPLAVRTGQAPVSFSWSAWPEGRHTLCAVANEGGAVEESGDENNIACATVMVRAPTQACDLELVTASLALSPQPAAAGDLLSITAIVRNIGALPCEPASVSFTDGLQLTRVALPALAPGAAQLLATTAVAFPGTQIFQVTADPDQLARDADRSNNVGTLESHTGAAGAPDFAVVAAASEPRPAFPGETVQLLATVRNLGAPAPTSQLELQFGSQSTQVVVPPLASGETLVVSATVTAPGSTVTGLARADVGGVVAELDETNNVATFTLEVQAPELTATASAAPSAAGPDTPVGLAVTLLNTKSLARELSVSVELVSQSGASVAQVASAMRVVAGSGTTALTVPWNTARTAPGAYLLEVHVLEAGRPLAAAQAPFTVLPEVATSSAVAVDRGRYAPKETVIILGRVENASRNVTLSGATATITVYDPLGVVLQSTLRPVPILLPLGHFDLSDSHGLSPMARPGTYTVVHEVRDGLGALAASSTASFLVEVVPALNITAQMTVSPVFPITPPLPVRVVLTNTSSVDLPAGVLSVELFDISGAQLLPPQSTSSKAVALAAGASRTDDFLLPTAGLQPGPKLLVTRLDGVILARLRVEAVAVTDNEPPVIDISGVFDLQVTRTDVTPVITITDFSAFSSAATLDGQPFASGTTVSAEGPHVLNVTATDVFGNSAFKAVRFTLDKTPPSLTLAGVANGAFSATPVTLTWTVADATPTTVVSTLNGAPFQSGDTVSTEGAWVWTVTATDAAGNSSTQTRQFVLDFTAPVITITGVAEGAYRRTPVQLFFSASDSSPVVATATLDGAPFTSGSTVTTEGPHTLTVTATDAAGNVSTATRSFTLDFTAPVISVTGVVDGALYATPRTITISVSDSAPTSYQATLDGAPFASGGTVSADGLHTLAVTASDSAGNTTQLTLQFRIDRTSPVISITGVTEGASGASFTPVITVSDATPATVDTTLDGAPFTSGTTITALGAHALRVVATDAAGNTADVTVHFTVVVGPRDPIFQFGVCATGNLSVRNSAQSTGGLAANGSMTLENSALVLGDVVAGGNLTLRNSARVTGRGRYGGVLSVSNSATVQGGTKRETPAPSPCQCSYDVDGALQAAAADNDNAAIAPVLSGGAIDLRHASVVLPGGTYYLTFLRLRNGSQLTVAVGQTARLFVAHNVQVENSSSLGGTPAQSGGLLVVSGADNSDGGFVELENATDTWLRLYAPRADIHLENASELTGAVVGKSLTLQNSHRLVSDAPSDGGLPLVCP